MGDVPNMIWFIGALTLAISGLAAQRASFSFVVKSAIAWAAIILVVLIAVSHRYELQAMFAGVSQRLGIDEQQVSGGTVRIRMSPDGHFWARVTVNGVERQMLVDSGATYTSLSEATAQAAGITPSSMTVQLNTANGIVNAQRARIARLAVGPLSTEDLGAVVSASFGDTDVLGMNFLSRLGSWRVEGKTLVLEPGSGGAVRDDIAADGRI